MEHEDLEKMYWEFQKGLIFLPTYLSHHPPLEDIAALRDEYLKKKREQEGWLTLKNVESVYKNLHVLDNLLSRLDSHLKPHIQEAQQKHASLEKKLNHPLLFFWVDSNNLGKEADRIAFAYGLLGNTIKQKEILLLKKRIHKEEER